MLERLIQGIEAAGLPKHGRGIKLAAMTGYSTTAISEFLRGEKPLGGRFIKLVCSALGLNYLWVATGSGEMFEKKNAGTLEAPARDIDPVSRGYVIWFESLPLAEKFRVYNQYEAEDKAESSAAQQCEELP